VVHLNDGDGGFASSAWYGALEMPRAFAAADFDGDGRVDILANSPVSFGEDLWLLRNRACPAGCAADFDGDGEADTEDVAAFLAAWGAREPEADFDQSGGIDTRDVVAFLNVWAAGCE
jgi:hypothetical protein